MQIAPLFRLALRPPNLNHVKLFHSIVCRHKNDQLPPRPTLPDSELHHVYLKGSGPGGQKINKTNSAVQLTHLPTGTVVKSQATRSRSQNHTIAKRLLAEKIEALERGNESRVAKVVERKRKKKASADKKKRRKYRKLDEGKEEDELDQDGGAEIEDLEGLDKIGCEEKSEKLGSHVKRQK